VTTRRVLAVLVVALVSAVSCGGNGTVELAGYERQPTVRVSDLRLTDYSSASNGVAFSPRATPGGVLLLYFGYLSCPDVCPLTMSDIATAVKTLTPAQRSRVSVGLVTVDPERDTGSDVDTYLRHFFASTPEVHVHGLRGADDASLRAAGDRLNARWEIEAHAPGAAVYAVSHTAVTYAVDDGGRLLREWPFGTPPDAVARTLRALLSEQRG
jgi:protein SCO1/2